MSETAKEGDYRLALEMYERCLKRTGHRSSSSSSPGSYELLLGYADSLARCGRLREAIDCYGRCLALGHHVPHDRLRHLANALLEELGVTTSTGSGGSPTTGAASFACPKCEGAMYQPVSLDCGHTFCRACCLDRVCLICGQEQQCQPEVNVLVQRLLEKWWPREAEASAARHEGDALAKKGLLGQALERYDLACQLGEYGALRNP